VTQTSPGDAITPADTVGDTVAHDVSVADRDRDESPTRRVLAMFERPEVLAQLGAACHDAVTPERLRSTLAQAMLKNPDLAQCSRRSILLAVLTAAKLGIDPTGTHNTGHFIPRWSKSAQCHEAHLQLGYGGLIAIARRASGVEYVEARVVYPGETFSVSLGTESRIEHGWSPTVDRDGEPVAYYAIASLTTGRKVFEVLTAQEVDSVCEQYGNRYGPVFSRHLATRIETRKKVPLLRLLKRLVQESDVPEIGRAVLSASDGHDARHDQPAPTPSDAAERLASLSATVQEVEE
jgi:recombination protein RecT